MDEKKLWVDFSGIFSFQFLIMMIIIALILLLLDGPRLKRDGYIKDFKLSKFFGVLYFVMGIFLFLLGKWIR